MKALAIIVVILVVVGVGIIALLMWDAIVSLFEDETNRDE